jgi:hypothetical protein
VAYKDTARSSDVDEAASFIPVFDQQTQHSEYDGIDDRGPLSATAAESVLL